MAPIINAQGLSKQYGIVPLFQNISFTVSEGDRIGLIGPNGSGKSTLAGDSLRPRQARQRRGGNSQAHKLSYVAQVSEFAAGGDGPLGDREGARASRPCPRRSARRGPPKRWAAPVLPTLKPPPRPCRGAGANASGSPRGWCSRPDILLLDEPTNHLDFAGIQWLETLLQNAPFACVVVSHDRYFLENIASEVVELNRVYADGLLRVKGNYSRFLEKKEEYLEAQGKRQDALTNRVHTELEWLRRGPKARRTKAKARIDKAHEMIGELADLNSRSRTATAKIDFSATDRQTKQLIALDDVTYAIGNRTLFEGIDFTVKSGMRVGLVGQNGSGKTTLLRLLRGDIEPSAARFAGPTRCGLSTSTRIANSIPT